MRAIVLFLDIERPRWWRWLLKRGFRHCMVLLEARAGEWIEVDPLAHRTFVRLWPFDDLSLSRIVAGGATAAVELVAPNEAPRRALWLWPATCVETVKRVIGLRAYWTITPWQLFRRLQRDPGFIGLETKTHGLFEVKHERRGPSGSAAT